ncbi:hypothetical protein [Kutzneria chonburiensis]|uniref:DUF304 domain-containing protein n=1 Tax=Kutzneria chonburiensis TaxID=1483604 RepID=A0ABV6MZR0_9PSEU|nr:hypothetical protein [Kutzneria chonburiensis]
MIRCLVEWLFRRRSLGFHYGRSFRPIILVLLVLTIVEGVIAELVLGYLLAGTFWPWLTLALHVYGLLWVLGVLASLEVRPHVIEDDALVLRDSAFSQLSIPLSAVRSFSKISRAGVLRSGLKVQGDVAMFAYGDANITVHIEPVDDPRLAGVRQIQFTVDDRESFLAAVEGVRAA